MEEKSYSGNRRDEAVLWLRVGVRHKFRVRRLWMCTLLCHRRQMRQLLLYSVSVRRMDNEERSEGQLGAHASSPAAGHGLRGLDVPVPKCHAGQT